MQRIDLIKVSSVRKHSRCKKQVSREQHEHHSFTYSASVHTRKKTWLPPQHLPHSLHYKPKLTTDSRLDSKNLTTPLVSSGSFATEPPNTWQPCLWGFGVSQHWLSNLCHTTPLSPTHSTARHHLPKPRLSFHGDTQQRSTVLHRDGIIHFHRPQESKPGAALLRQRGPSSFQLLTSHHSLQNQLFPFQQT